MARALDSRKVRQWQRRLERFARYQRPVTRFCQDEKVSVASFYHWRRKLQQVSQPTAGTASRFRPVQLVAASILAVRLPGGTQLEVPTADPRVLQLAIQTLAQADAQRMTGAESC